MTRASNNLAQVMRCHISSHTNRNTGCTVDQKIRERGGQNSGLHELVVVVGHKIYDVLVQVVGERKSCGIHASFGVARCRRAVIQRTKVAMTIDERQTHRKGLRQAHHRIVNSGITVRVQFTHDLAHHASRFHMAFIGAQTHLLHHI